MSGTCTSTYTDGVGRTHQCALDPLHYDLHRPSLQRRTGVWWTDKQQDQPTEKRAA